VIPRKLTVYWSCYTWKARLVGLVWYLKIQTVFDLVVIPWRTSGCLRSCDTWTARLYLTLWYLKSQTVFDLVIPDKSRLWLILCYLESLTVFLILRIPRKPLFDLVIPKKSDCIWSCDTWKVESNSRPWLILWYLKRQIRKCLTLWYLERQAV
jgi:hypothetical protein